MERNNIFCSCKNKIKERFLADPAKSLYYLCKSFSLRFTEKPGDEIFVGYTRLLFIYLTHFSLGRVIYVLKQIHPLNKMLTQNIVWCVNLLPINL